jgi:hypothetical protein
MKRMTIGIATVRRETGPIASTTVPLRRTRQPPWYPYPTDRCFALDDRNLARLARADLLARSDCRLSFERCRDLD